MVELDGQGSGGAQRPRPAIVDVALLGAAQAGDEVIVNTQALDLGLGSGGFDIVHVNLTLGLRGDGAPDGERDEAQLHEPAAHRATRRGRAR